MADLADGETCEIKGSAAKPYIIKNMGGVYSCSCPAWRNQSVAIESRTCKHIRKLRGEAAEKDRIGAALPAVPKSTAKKDAPPLLLAHAWDNAIDLQDWWMSEKLDGVRAYWTGTMFLSRLGNQYHAPEWFTAGLPAEPLDGELWIGRGQFQRCVSIVRRQDRSDLWQDVSYVIFDAPDREDPFEQRVAYLNDTAGASSWKFATVLSHLRCQGEAHLRQELKKIDLLGGEGLMLREPASHYEVGRSSTLLKVKKFHDAEATVVAHTAGRGKHKGRLGALVVHLSDGTQFNVGTGLSDKQRQSPPGVGSVITFRYQEMSDAGVPRFPSFLRVIEEPVPAAQPTGVPAGAMPVANDPAMRNPEPELEHEPKIDAAAGAKDSQRADSQYFELSDSSSNKFWEISQSGCAVTVRYGRIGTSGTSKTKSFADEPAATRHSEKLIAQKAAKGYVLRSGPTE